MSAESSTTPCPRCGRPLPEGARFCVACGCHNFDAEGAQGAIHSRLHQAGEGRERLRGLARAARAFRFFRWFG